LAAKPKSTLQAHTTPCHIGHTWVRVRPTQSQITSSRAKRAGSCTLVRSSPILTRPRDSHVIQITQATTLSPDGPIEETHRDTVRRAPSATLATPCYQAHQNSQIFTTTMIHGSVAPPHGSGAEEISRCKRVGRQPAHHHPRQPKGCRPCRRWALRRPFPSSWRSGPPSGHQRRQYRQP